MAKFLIGLVAGILLAILTAVVLVFSLLRFGGERKPVVADNSTLVMRLNGEIPEKAPVEIPIPFIGRPEVATVREVWINLKKAAADNRIKAIVLIPEHLDIGWAKADEIRHDLLEFKKSHKPVIAYLRRPRTREYYIATAADRIYMSPEDMLDMKGLRAELMYFKKTLDKLGVQVEVTHIGKYKNAGDMFTETTSTPETRDVMNSLLDSLYGDLVNTVAQSRHKSPDDVRAIVDKGPFMADQAKANGLVDDLKYEDQVYGEVKDRLKQSEVKKLAFSDYMHVPASSVGVSGKKNIAFIVGEGTIVTGSGRDAMGTDEGFSSGAFIQMLRRVRDDKSISGVILRVDSPGGDAIASDEILREVKLLSQKKPMVISMSDEAASGGYYVAMTGDPILAYPQTFTGSIGIIYGKLNLHGLYDKLGITKDIMMRGKNADIDSDYHPLTEAGRAKLEQSLQEFYRGFVSKAAQSRKRPYDQVEPLAQGRVWLGGQAKANGLIDEIGGIDSAIAAVKRKAGIAASETVTLVPYPPRRSILDQWLRSSSETAVETEIRHVLGPLDYKLWSRGGFMRVMPYQIVIQ